MFRTTSNVVLATATWVLLATLSSQPAGADDELTAAVRALATQMTQMQDRLAALEEKGDEGPSLAATYAVRNDANTELALRGASLKNELEYMAAKVEALETRLIEPETEDTGAEVGDESSDEITTPPLPKTMREKSSYLPSRGWLEGMHYGSEEIEVNLHAFIDSEYVDAGPDGSRSGNSTFDNHHSNFFVTAYLQENLRAHTEFEFEHSGGEVEIDQAFMEWAPKDWLTLTAGRFYSPFGIERFVWYSPTNALVTRPEPMRQIVPGNFYANGLMVSGNLDSGERSKFTYELSVANGLEADAATSRRGSRQDRDNNSDNAVTARLGFSPHPNFEFGVSHHSQQYDDSNRLGLEFFGVDFAGRWSGWELRSEYVEATIETEFEDDLGAILRGADLEQDGWYGQLGYTYYWFRTWLPALTLVTRYDSVDLDGSVIWSDDRDFWSLGVNALIHDHFRLKAEYRVANEEGPSKDNDTFLSQFVIDF